MPAKRKAPVRSTTTKRKTKKEESESESSSEEDIQEELSSSGGEADSSSEEEMPVKKSKRVSQKEETKKAENAGAEKLGLEWTNYHSTLMILSSDQLKPTDKVMSFDMDGTLVNPKSGAKFPKSRSDWVWLFKEVPDKLRELNKNGFKIVIFTNQAGIEKNKQNPRDLTGKIIDLSVELGFPIQAFISAATNHFRKPNTTMWDIFVEKYNGGIVPDTSVSFYVGDAAGRAKEWKRGMKKDFSTSDRAFANNIGLEFKTPEEFFYDEKPAPFEWGSIDPAALLKQYEGKSGHDEKDIVGDVEGQELIVMVGRPASGKSSFAKKFFVARGYEHVNQDTLKTKDKCIRAAKAAIGEGKSVIVDNTCPSVEARKDFTKIAKDAGVPFRCFWFDTDVDLAHHLNFFREKMTEGEVRRIPDVAYNMYKSKFQEPTTKEGFTEVRKVSWFPEFKDEKMKKLFLQRT